MNIHNCLFWKDFLDDVSLETKMVFKKAALQILHIALGGWDCHRAKLKIISCSFYLIRIFEKEINFV